MINARKKIVKDRLVPHLGPPAHLRHLWLACASGVPAWPSALVPEGRGASVLLHLPLSLPAYPPACHPKGQSVVRYRDLAESHAS